jgi:hypothetical protein
MVSAGDQRMVFRAGLTTGSLPRPQHMLRHSGGYNRPMTDMMRGRSHRPSQRRPMPSGKPRCAPLLEGQGISPGVMPERDWRQLFITGTTPEQAAEQVRAKHYNTRRVVERMRKR